MSLDGGAGACCQLEQVVAARQAGQRNIDNQQFARRIFRQRQLNRQRFAGVVGRERVIASTDSGFAAFAGDRMVDPKVAFKKLDSLVRGAAIATRRLWGRS